MWVMYVDDGSLTDMAAAKGKGQACVHAFFEEIGTGLSTDKREWMSKTTTFLGIEHCWEHLCSEEFIEFGRKEALEQKLRVMMNNFEQNERCTPAEASKFRGVAGFAAQAQYGQLGRAPLRPYKMR